MTVWQQRIDRLRVLLRKMDIDSCLIKKPSNILYFTGFRGTSGYFLLTNGNQFLLTDFRYREQALQETAGVELIIVNNTEKVMLEIADVLRREKASRLGFEGDSITYLEYNKLAQSAAFKIELISASETIDKIRSLKEHREVEKISKAACLADQAFHYILQFIEPGVTERKIAAEIECFFLRSGAEKVSFPPIVASGFRSALPHGRASLKKIRRGELLLFDFGAVVDDYCSDITRVVRLHPPTNLQQEIHSIVLEAQQRALNAISPGASLKDIDAAARSFIEQKGYGSNFGHGLGHGIGLSVHEYPKVSADSSDLLSPGMVFTVEPGIYLPGWGGVRIEDMIAVNEEGYQILTKSTREILLI